jgi:hypothetical protein
VQLFCLPYMPHAPAISLFLVDHPNNIWKLVCSLLHSPVTLSPLRCKCLPRHLIFENLQPMFLLQCASPSFKLTQNDAQIK